MIQAEHLTKRYGKFTAVNDVSFEVHAGEVIRFYGRVRKLTAALADEALARANFNDFSDKAVGEFSGGMVQRLGLEVASMPDAPILLLDGPTANLDPQGVKRFREFM